MGELKNLFNKDTAISGKYIAFQNGNLATNASYYASDWIPVLPNTVYTKVSSQQLAFYDENKVYISGLSSTSTFKTPVNCYYVRITIENTLLNREQLEVGSVSTNYVPYGYTDINLSRNFTVVAKDGTGDFTTISEACDYTNECGTVLVMPGIYAESVDVKNKEISIVGVNRKTCILKSQSEDYYYPPLEISAGYVANMTIYAEDLQNVASKNLTPYAVHIDYNYQTGKTLEFYNCNIISDFQAAAGVGLRKDFMLTFKNCDLISNQKNSAFGGLFFHDTPNSETGDQYLVVDNCNIYSKDSKVAMSPYSLGDTRNRTFLTFKRNCFFSKPYGITPEIIAMQITSSGDAWNGTNNFYLTGDSFGNNIPILNAQ